MKSLNTLALVATLSTLAGCATPAAVVPAEKTVTVVGEVQAIANDGRLLAVVSPWVKADIGSVVLTLATQAAPTTTVATATVNDLTKQVSFTNLHQGTAYQITATAFTLADGAGTRIDNLVAGPTGCTTTFTTTTDDLLTLTGGIKLRLQDKTFAGATNDTTVTVTNGQVVDTTTTTGISVH